MADDSSKWPRLKSGRYVTPYEVEQRRRAAQRDLYRWWRWNIKLVAASGDLEVDAFVLERLDAELGDLERIVKDLRRSLDVRLGVLGKRERIARLRVTTGRTPEEERLFRDKADELERELEG